MLMTKKKHYAGLK